MLGFCLKRNDVPTSNSHRGNGDRPLIDLRDVVKTFESAAGKFTALKGIDLQVNAGEFVTIVGKSGCGKSTLINMITGIDRPTSGEVLVGGTAVHTLSEGQIAVWRGRTIGVVFQFFQLLPTLTAVENVMLPMDFGKRYAPGERYERAHAPAGTGGHGRSRAQAAAGAVRRAAAERGDRPRAGQRSAAPGRRRADRQPGFQDRRRGLSAVREAWWTAARRS